MMPLHERSRPDGNRGGSSETIDFDHTIRGPYQTALGELRTCPRHPWAAPSLSIIGGTMPVCWQGGHFVDPAEVAA
jgi:hypothetical protein